MLKLSFVIVAFNAEKALPYSLCSLSKQDYPHDYIEVILVDGNSQDNTKQLMLDFKEKESSFKRVVVLDNPKRYLACGWNVALKEISGEVVLRVDAHTEFPPDFISKNIRFIEEGKDICGGKVQSILLNDTPWSRTLLSAENSMFGGGFTFFRRGEIPRYTDTLAFAAYRKEIFDKVGPYDERLVRTEDNEMHYRMRKAGYRFFFSPDIVSYRFNRSSLKGLLKQKFLNGYWVGLTHAVSPNAFSVFYLVPLLFVLALVTGIVLLSATAWPFIGLLISYAVVLLLALAGAISRDGFRWQIILLPAIILGLHIYYGVGTAKGLCEEDYKMRHCPKKMGNGVLKIVYWLAELVLLPFKSISWAVKLLVVKD